MARRCELTGKGPQSGHNVSHAVNRTKRVFRPNLQKVALASELLGNAYVLKISMNALRTVDKVRLVRGLGRLSDAEQKAVLLALGEMFSE